MKALITGGLGQIGSHVAEMMLDRGDQVLVIDNLATGRQDHLAQNDNLRVVIGSIADGTLVTKTFLRILSLTLLFMQLHPIKILMIGIMMLSLIV